MPWTKKQARFFETDTAKRTIPRHTLAKMRRETHAQYRGEGFARQPMRSLKRASKRG